MSDVSRRSLLTGVCASIALGVVNIPIAAEASVKKLSNGRLSVKVSAIPELSKVGGAVRIGKYKGQEVGVARTGASRYVAFNLACPHQGVTVIREGNGWVCPAHRSEFEANGNLMLGPATSGLVRVPSRLSRGQLIIG